MNMTGKPVRLFRVGGLAIAIALSAGVVLGTPPQSAFASAFSAPKQVKNVSGTAAARLPVRTKPKSATSVKAPTRVTPNLSQFTVDMSAKSAPQVAPRSLPSVFGKLAGGWQELGATGITIAPVSQQSASSGDGSQLGGLKVRALSAAEMKTRGLVGIALELSRTDASDATAALAVSIPNKYLVGQFGADFASRLQWTETPETSLMSHSALTRVKSPIAVTQQSAASASTLVSAQAVESPMVLAATATPVSSTGTGTFAATPFNSATSWDVSAQTGDFSWSYPLRTPPAAAGPSPDLALNYDSQSIDGQTGSSNNQSSAIGNGWTMGGTGFIDRQYIPCSQDTTGAVTTSGDLCWQSNNATLSMDGHSGTLVPTSTAGIWKLKNDDGTRVQYLSGSAGCVNGDKENECWVVTTTDGTQYWFGKNQLPGWTSTSRATNSTWTVPVFGNSSGEPCRGATFALSSCSQAWRWNLDYVVDTHSNAEALYYSTETNKYALDASKTATVSYTRGGQVIEIDYGLGVNAYGPASDEVKFSYSANGRCLSGCDTEATNGVPTSTPTKAATTPANYPDVPWDQYCTAAACASDLSPTFWTDAMLATITTYAMYAAPVVSGPPGTPTMTPVDIWNLAHTFPSPGDTTAASLWLSSVQHLSGAISPTQLSEPATTFGGVPLHNRVYVVNGWAPLAKYRLNSIQTSLGGLITVSYADQGIDPTTGCSSSNAVAIEANLASNTHQCYAQWWDGAVTPPQVPKVDLFYKYVVASVISNPESGGAADQSEETDYVYTGVPKWRFDDSPYIPANRQTWNIYAGYSSVEVRKGASSSPTTQQTTDYTFFQGMNGDRASTSGTSTKSVSVGGVTDSLQYAGRTREVVVRSGVGGSIISDTVVTPESVATTPVPNPYVPYRDLVAYLANDADSLDTQPLAASAGSRTIETKSQYDATYGFVTQREVDTSDAGSKCTITQYSPVNTSAWIVGLPIHTTTFASTCAVAAVGDPAPAIAETSATYDGGGPGGSPLLGNQLSTDVVDSYEADASGQEHESGAQWARAATTTYDSLGRPLVVSDVLGHTTTASYTPSASGPMTTETVRVTAPFSWPTVTTIDPRWGVATNVVNANGNPTVAQYDVLGRITGVWDARRPVASYPSAPTEAYAYSESLTAANSIRTTSLAPNNTITSYALFDGLGRSIQSQSPAEAGATKIATTDYDAAGNVDETDGPYAAAGGTPGALFVPSSLTQVPSWSTTQFDGAGRITASILHSYTAERSRTTHTYAGDNEIDTTPPAGGTPSTTFTNSLGETTSLVQQFLPATPSSAAVSETTTYAYDAQGAMISMVDPAGHSWTWAYDTLGHQTNLSSPDDGTTTSAYDDAGNLTNSTDADGNAISYKYDELNRKTGEYTGLDSASGALLDSWTYDTLQVGTPQQSVDRGALATSTSYSGSEPGVPGLAYTESIDGYNANDQPTGTTTSIPVGAPAFGGTSYDTALYYNQAGSLSEEDLPAEGGLPEEDLTTSYDSIGTFAQLSGIATYAFDATYSGIGQLASIQRDGATNLETSFGYDPATGAIDQIEQTAHSGSTFSTPSNIQYSYDGAGNVTSEVTAADSRSTDTQCFSYDQLRELTNAWTPSDGNCSSTPDASTIGGPSPYWDSYVIDPATGNRVSATEYSAPSGNATTIAYTYPSGGPATVQPHAVTKVETTTAGDYSSGTFVYDAAGNATAIPGSTVTYDAEGKVSSIQTGDDTDTNIYDASGALLMQTDSTTGTTLFLGATELHLTSGSNTPTAVRTYTAAGLPVAERTTDGTSATDLKWLGTDAQGTANIEVDTTTGVVTYRAQDPFGNLRGAGAWSSDHDFLNQPQTGQTGLTLLGARVYDAAIGKFLSVDSVIDPSNPEQNNGYSYADNNPITLSDPTGLSGDSSDPPSWSLNNPPPPPSCDVPYQCAGDDSNVGEDGTPSTGTPQAPGRADGNEVCASSCKPVNAPTDLEGEFRPAGAALRDAVTQATGGLPLGGAGCGEAQEICAEAEEVAGALERSAAEREAGERDGEDNSASAEGALIREDLPDIERFAAEAEAGIERPAGMSAGAWGSRVHNLWETLVRQNAPGSWHQEISFKGGDYVPYATKGSVRLDMVDGNLSFGKLGSVTGVPRAIFDLKTGNAKLTDARITAIRAQLPPSWGGVPIIQIKATGK
jgi:RHS repeat-associated protein